MDTTELVAQARYACERYQLYLARLHGSRRSSLKRLRELEQASELAQARLRRAQSAARTAQGEAGS